MCRAHYAAAGADALRGSPRAGGRCLAGGHRGHGQLPLCGACPPSRPSAAAGRPTCREAGELLHYGMDAGPPRRPRGARQPVRTQRRDRGRGRPAARCRVTGGIDRRDQRPGEPHGRSPRMSCCPSSPATRRPSPPRPGSPRSPCCACWPRRWSTAGASRRRRQPCRPRSLRALARGRRDGWPRGGCGARRWPTAPPWSWSGAVRRSLPRTTARSSSRRPRRSPPSACPAARSVTGRWRSRARASASWSWLPPAERATCASGWPRRRAGLGSPTWLIGDDAAGLPPATDRLRVTTLPAVDEAYAPLTMSVPIQRLAAILARERGRVPGVLLRSQKVTDRE